MVPWKGVGRMNRSAVVALFTAGLLTSCNENGLFVARGLIASGDYVGALERLSSLGNSPEADRLRATALLVEGATDEGFDALHRASLDSADAGRLLFAAASQVIREKRRTQEAIQLLDSALVNDPVLRSEVAALLWNRGVEYLKMTGDGGLNLFEAAIRLDPLVAGRLQGFDVALARRLEELQAIRSVVQRLQEGYDRLQDGNASAPGNMMDLLIQRPDLTPHTDRKGWLFCLERSSSGRMFVIAEARAITASGVPAGTRIGIK